MNAQDTFDQAKEALATMPQRRRFQQRLYLDAAPGVCRAYPPSQMVAYGHMLLYPNDWPHLSRKTG